jgi:hypothetical protein
MTPGKGVQALHDDTGGQEQASWDDDPNDETGWDDDPDGQPDWDWRWTWYQHNWHTVNTTPAHPHYL